MSGALESVAGLRIFIVEDETLIVEEMEEMARCAIDTLIPDMPIGDLDRPAQPNTPLPLKISARPTFGRRQDGSTICD